MADRSKIEWTDASWNPVRAAWRVLGQKTQGVGGHRPIGWHCEHVSEGCRNCYAEGFNLRLGTRLDYKPGNRDVIDIFLDEKLLLQPLHTFQFLTKRPARMRAYLSAARAHPVALAAMGITFTCMAGNPKSDVGKGIILHGDICHLKVWPLPNVWLGVSCEDEDTTLERCEHMAATPAAVRFVSCEPLLAEISEELNEFMGTCTVRIPENVAPIRPFDSEATIGGIVSGLGGMITPNNDRAIDWVIVGGESGPNARPTDPDWIRSIRDLCACAGVPFFFKQWGEWAPDAICGEHVRFSARNPGPELHGWPYDEGTDTWRIGKRRAGRLLDGIEHSAFPEATR